MVDKNFLAKLYENFELKTRDGLGGMKFKYIPSDAVIDRMNKVFHGYWCTEVLSEVVTEDQVLVKVRVTVKMPDSNELFWHEGYGSSSMNRFKSGPNEGKLIDLGNAYKAAEAMAIRHACSRFGVGLYQEGSGEDYFEYGEGKDDVLPKLIETGPEEPGNYKITGDLPEKTETKTSTPPAEESEALKTSTISKKGPSMPKPPSLPGSQQVVPPMPIGDAPKSSEASEEKAKTGPSKTKRSLPPGMPKIPQPNGAGPSRPKSNSNPPHSSVPGPSKDAGVTDVQRAALEGILSIQGVEYPELVKQAFEEYNIECTDIPEIDDLTYKQAVAVVKHGNALFRKQ